jgi:hypothetical protein
MCFPKLPDYPASCFPQSPTWGLRDFQAFEQQVPWALRAQRMAGTPARTCLAGLLIHLITHLVQSRTGTHLATPAQYLQSGHSTSAACTHIPRSSTGYARPPCPHWYSWLEAPGTTFSDGPHTTSIWRPRGYQGVAGPGVTRSCNAG